MKAAAPRGPHFACSQGLFLSCATWWVTSVLGEVGIPRPAGLGAFLGSMARGLWLLGLIPCAAWAPHSCRDSAHHTQGQRKLTAPLPAGMASAQGEPSVAPGLASSADMEGPKSQGLVLWGWRTQGPASGRSLHPGLPTATPHSRPRGVKVGALSQAEAAASEAGWGLHTAGGAWSENPRATSGTVL